MRIIIDFAGEILICLGVLIAMAGFLNAAGVGPISNVIFWIGLALSGVGWALYSTKGETRRESRGKE